MAFPLEDLMKTVSLLALLLLSVPVVMMIGVTTQEKPSVMTVIGPPPPVGDLRELAAKTPIIVFAVVQHTLPPEVDRGQDVIHIQLFTIKEVVKDEGDLLKGRTTIQVKQYGDTAKIGERVVMTKHPIEPLKQGEAALLFLSPVDTNTFHIPYGSMGSFTLSREDPQVFEVAAAAQRLPELGGRHRVGKAELIGMLRRADKVR